MLNVAVVRSYFEVQFSKSSFRQKPSEARFLSDIEACASSQAASSHDPWPQKAPEFAQAGYKYFRNVGSLSNVSLGQGEKYLILKRKYKQMMQERESNPTASGQKLKTNAHQVEWSVGPTITVTDAQEPDEGEDVSTKMTGSLIVVSKVFKKDCVL